MEKKKFSRKAKITVSLAAFFLLAGGGIAYAYWTTTGTGSGATPAATSSGTVTIAASFTSGIVPGGTRAVTYTAANPGTSKLMVKDISHLVTTSDVGCLPAWFTIPPVNSNTVVPAGATAQALTGSGTLTFVDSATVNQDACKGATITLTLTSD